MEMQAEAGQMNRLFEDAEPKPPNVETQLCSTAELAKVLGVTKGRISQLDKQGIFEREEKRGRFFYFGLTKSVQSYCLYLKDQKGSKSEQSEQEKYVVAKRRKVEVETARIEGHLINTEEMKSAMVQDNTSIRQNLLSVTGRIAEALALDTEEMQLVDSIVKKALELEGEGSPDF